MYLKLENKLPHLNQLFHVLYGFAIITLFQFLSPDSASSLPVFATKLSFLLLSFSVVIYVWWRQLELYQIGYMRKPGYVVFAFARIFVLFFLLFFARNVLNTTEISTLALQQFTFTVFLLCVIALVQDALIIRPTYGKERVFIRRELWQDVFLGVISLGWFAMLYFGIAAEHTWMEFTAVIVAVLLVRPIARMLTQWKELAPPHRGGRRPRSEQRQAQRGGRSGSRGGTRPQGQQRSEASGNRGRQQRSTPSSVQQNRSSSSGGQSRTGSRSNRSSRQQSDAGRQTRQQSQGTPSAQEARPTRSQTTSSQSAQQSSRRRGGSRRSESKPAAAATPSEPAEERIQPVTPEPSQPVEQKTADLGSSADAAPDQPGDQPVRKLRTASGKRPARQPRSRTSKSDQPEQPAAAQKPVVENEPVAQAPKNEPVPPVTEPDQPTPEVREEQERREIVYGRKGTRKSPKLPDDLAPVGAVDDSVEEIKIVPDEIPENAFGRRPKKKTTAPVVDESGEKGGDEEQTEKDL